MTKRLLPRRFSRTLGPETAKKGLKKRTGVVRLLKLYSAALFFLCVVVFISIVEPQNDIGTLTRDSAATYKGHQLTGLVSNIGILLWAVAANTCIFSYAIYRRLEPTHPLTRFFLWFGLFTSALLADDLFMLHEEDSMYHFPETVLFTVYLSFLLIILKSFHRHLFQKKSVLFWLSLLFFGLSIAIDVPDYGVPIKGMVFIEDSLKFLGIVSWTGFLVGSS